MLGKNEVGMKNWKSGKNGWHMNRMGCLVLGLLAVACTVWGQEAATQDQKWNLSVERLELPNTKKVNFGFKAGFSSSKFMVSELKIKDATIDEVQNNYKIGYFGSVFMRFYMKKHFIQPEISYNVSKGEIVFDKLGSQHPDIEPDYAGEIDHPQCGAAGALWLQSGEKGAIWHVALRRTESEVSVGQTE